MEVRQVDRERIDEAALRAAVEVLARGGIVVYPTESLYGLGADARSPAAIERLRSLKGRDPGQAVSVIVSDMAMIEQWAVLNEQARAWASEFWPGPLTLILPRRPGLTDALGGAGLGIRIPGLDWPRELARGLGSAITATSANPAGAADAQSVQEVIAGLGEGLDLVLDAGPIGQDPASTIIDLCGPWPVIIREGAIPISKFRHLMRENIAPCRL